MAQLPWLAFGGVVLLTILQTGTADLPCMARDVGIEGRSVVCVCNADYCDTITRTAPNGNRYVAYTSSNSGKRFEQSTGSISIGTRSAAFGDEPADDKEADEYWSRQPEHYDDEDATETVMNINIRLYPDETFQTIEGFGGSVTDAAAINWRKLSDAVQARLIDTYFGPEGLEYNMIRVPIAGCDFSEHPYTYNEEPWYDAALSNFSLTNEDYFLKLPMIKRSQQVATDEVKITASTWSPPVWMKTNERITGFAQVRPEYYQSYADYHIRFIEEYEKADVKIWAITTSNEPLNGLIPVVDFNSIGWTPSQLARWVANNLGPTIRNSKYNDTLILAVDDQRYIVPIWLAGMEAEDPKSIEYIDGVAIHYYGNFVPSFVLSRVHDRYPGKILLSTEACEGPMPWDRTKVILGSWRRAGNYIRSILQDLNNYVVGWIDWNLCLDPQGGPNWVENFVDAPIIVDGDRNEFIKQPMFYAMGHFSKFIPRGSMRIRSARRSLFSVEHVAFIKPDGNYVVVMQSRGLLPRIVRINISALRYIEIQLEPQSVQTIEINPRLF